MARDIANEDPRLSLGEGGNREEIAANRAGRKVTVAELEGTGRLGAGARESRILLRQHGQLNLARHFEVLLHHLVFGAQLPTALRHEGSAQ